MLCEMKANSFSLESGMVLVIAACRSRDSLRHRTMWKDPIIEESRSRREKLAACLSHDIKSIGEVLRRVLAPRSTGHGPRPISVSAESCTAGLVHDDAHLSCWRSGGELRPCRLGVLSRSARRGVPISEFRTRPGTAAPRIKALSARRAEAYGFPISSANI